MTGSNGAGEGHGAAVRRVEDPPFLRGTRPYTDDLREPEALYAVFVRSGFAHARVGGIDTAEAAAMPGVVGVYTAADLKLEDFPAGGPPVPTPEAMRRPVLASRRRCASSASRSPSSSPRRAGRPSTPPSSSTSTSTRSTPSST